MIDTDFEAVTNEIPIDVDYRMIRLHIGISNHWKFSQQKFQSLENKVLGVVASKDPAYDTSSY